MIFLGAGASKIFGVKTLQETTDDLIRVIKDRDCGDIIDAVIGKLSKFEIVVDFEAIYTILDALSDPRQSIKEMGAFAAFMCRNDIGKHPEYGEILKDFKNYLYQECTIKPGFLEEVRSAYDRLFDFLGKASLNEQRFSYGSQPTGAFANFGNTIVTTNYDMSVELYHMMKKQALADGFRPPSPYIPSFESEMDLSTYSQLAGGRWLIKLHGSIWQYKHGNRIFKTIDDPKKSTLPINIEENMMIYPTGEKPILKDPYYSFYSLFKAQRWLKLIAIGYSFRDDPVNTAILENLERVENSTLIIVDPKAEEVIRNLGSVKRYLPRIIRIPNRFGEDIVFDKLELAIAVDSYKQYREKLFSDKHLYPIS